jgi:hypothetical protein
VGVLAVFENPEPLLLTVLKNFDVSSEYQKEFICHLEFSFKFREFFHGKQKLEKLKVKSLYFTACFERSISNKNISPVVLLIRAQTIKLT